MFRNMHACSVCMWRTAAVSMLHLPVHHSSASHNTLLVELLNTDNLGLVGCVLGFMSTWADTALQVGYGPTSRAVAGARQ